ncbi:unnamed protein product [Acanthoscelides obtectus]|uniref:MADF domain-containing protein n=1 Tax=Acanthoscelides obtectus TaxID=200917 RepID=A0A9P0P3K2_ACAOB|nr:unnamed protein product [Acanthoscelides obtectus]CAH2003514.1 unnamed protein product [Acanthoscelides obtectus]CAK1657053.1 hypothetical protein AOBTE_LOCUS20089 [Acanthoscelides obtectus]CAK1672544.1 hypothetical protein AOBTE_LOCUS28956 [Acanthoscelides obtectus]
MYEEIAKELRQKTNQNITGSDCENIWKHLERMFKKYVDNNNKTGRGRREFEYAEAMEDILGKKRNIHPVVLLSSDTIIHPTTQVVTGDNSEKENLVEFPKTKELLSTSSKATDVTAPQRITNMNKNKERERKLTEKKEKMTFYRKKN